MTANIYIYSCGEFVEKFDVDYDSLDDLREIESYAMHKYSGHDQFALYVMIH